MVGVAVRVCLRLCDADAGAVEIGRLRPQQRHPNLIKVLRPRTHTENAHQQTGKQDGLANQWVHEKFAARPKVIHAAKKIQSAVRNDISFFAFWARLRP